MKAEKEREETGIQPVPFEVVELPLDQLKPHPKNYTEHPPEQIDHLIARIRQFNVYKEIIIARENTILAGHGLTEALKKMGRKTASCRRYDLSPDDPIALKLLAGDNELESLRIDNQNKLADLLGEIQAGDINGLLGTGYSDASFADLSTLVFQSKGGDGDGEPDPYSRKIDAPIYEPEREKPLLCDLLDTAKTNALLDEIDAADIPLEIKTFLIHAAHRHTVFNFSKVADFYAHSDMAIQALMERSALVIIDLEQAIENGFVKLSQGIAEQYSEDFSDDTE